MEGNPLGKLDELSRKATGKGIHEIGDQAAASDPGHDEAAAELSSVELAERDMEAELSAEQIEALVNESIASMLKAINATTSIRRKIAEQLLNNRDTEIGERFDILNAAPAGIDFSGLKVKGYSNSRGQSFQMEVVQVRYRLSENERHQRYAGGVPIVDGVRVDISNPDSDGEGFPIEFSNKTDYNGELDVADAWKTPAEVNEGLRQGI